MSEIELPSFIKQISDPLPDPDIISYYILEHERKIYLDYDVDGSLTEFHRLILRWNMEDQGIEPDKRNPIWLYIMSYGGDIDYMRMLLGAIEASVTPVYTVNLGDADSAAALIFMAGKQRYMAKYSRVVIHEGAAVIGGDAQKVQDQAESYKKAVQWMKDYILSHTNIPKKELMKRRAHDWELDAEYCLANGVCDHIIASMDEVI